MGMQQLAALLGLEDEETLRAQGLGAGTTGGHAAEVPSIADMPAPDARTRGPIVAQAPAPTEAAPAPAAQPSRVGPAKQEDGSWSPDWLAAVAAFTRNPALMQKLQAREAAKANAPRLEMEQAKEAREAEKHAAMLPYYGAQAESRKAYADKTSQDMRLRAEANDPASPTSKSFVQSAAAALESWAQLNGGSEIAKTIWERAKGLAGQSYEQAKATLAALGPVGKAALAKAENDRAASMRKEGLSQGWASLGETKTEHLRQDEDRDESRAMQAEARADVTIRRPQEQLNKDISGLEVARQQMMRLKKLKPGVNTGPLIQGLRNLFGADKFDEFTDGKRIDVRGLAARIFNKETKSLAGTAVTDSEWARISPQIPEVTDDDDAFMTKLDLALEETERILSERRKEYQTKFGKPIDSSTTARESVAKTRPTAATPGARPEMGIDPEKAAKIVRAKAILNDPNEPPEKKAKAQKWLQQNAAQ